MHLESFKHRKRVAAVNYPHGTEERRRQNWARKILSPLNRHILMASEWRKFQFLLLFPEFLYSGITELCGFCPEDTCPYTPSPLT